MTNRAGWVNHPGTSDAVLVEHGNGCVVKEASGKTVSKPRIMLSPKPVINKTAFVQHLKSPGNELFVPYMYLDSESNVTVGIGHLLSNAAKAQILPFMERGTGKPANKQHIANAFNKVKRSNLAPGAWLAFKNLTHIEMSEADATTLAMDNMDDFINILKTGSYFPEFDSYPVTAKMGLLDMTYTLGANKLKNVFKKFTAAVRRRNWKLAARESHRKQPSAQRNQIVWDWFQQAARQEHFFIHPTCTKRLSLLIK